MDQKQISHVADQVEQRILSLEGVDKGPDPRKVDTSGVSYVALVSVAEFSASKTSGARRLHQ